MTVVLITVVALTLLSVCVKATLHPHNSPSLKPPHNRVSQPETAVQDHGLLPDDQNTEAQTQLGAEHGGHGKYFMYQHVPHKDHYEFGYRRGNDHHFKEKYEKAHPHHGHFMTKARWGDKHGGYGEHYWDYNHGGHHGDDGGSNDEGGEESDPVEDYQINEPDQDERVKRAHNEPQPAASVLDVTAGGGINLAYDMESGTVVDETTGQRYLLTPIN